MTSRGRSALLVASTAFVFGLGLWVGTRTGEQRSVRGGVAETGATVSAPDTAPLGSNRVARPDRPGGYPRSRAGAVSAAADFAAMLGGPLVLEPTSYQAAIRRIAATEARGRLIRGAAQTAGFLESRLGLMKAGRLGEPVIYRSALVGYAVDRFSRDEAAVRLWTASVVGRGGGQGVSQVWGTTTLRLRWEGGWRLADWEQSPGPTPSLPGVASPGESSALLLATSDLRGFRYAPDAR